VERFADSTVERLVSRETAALALVEPTVDREVLAELFADKFVDVKVATDTTWELAAESSV